MIFLKHHRVERWWWRCLLKRGPSQKESSLKTIIFEKICISFFFFWGGGVGKLRMGPSKNAFTFQIRPIFHFLFWQFEKVTTQLKNCHTLGESGEILKKDSLPVPRAPAPFIGPWQGANEQSAEQPGQVTCEVADLSPHLSDTFAGTEDGSKFFWWLNRVFVGLCLIQG